MLRLFLVAQHKTTTELKVGSRPVQGSFLFFRLLLYDKTKENIQNVQTKQTIFFEKKSFVFSQYRD